jgi:hypothetical protein
MRGRMTKIIRLIPALAFGAFLLVNMACAGPATRDFTVTSSVDFNRCDYYGAGRGQSALSRQDDYIQCDRCNTAYADHYTVAAELCGDKKWSECNYSVQPHRGK